MFKKILFQLHWLLGISAGLVLVVVGVTGAMLSFEKQLLTLANPHVISVPETIQARLSMQDLIDRIEQQEPNKRIAAITLQSDPSKAGRVGFALAPDSKIKKGLDNQYVNPYTGQLLGKANGESFFLTVMKLHRWLVLDDVGKQVVGASNIALVFLCISGLYLRWPRQLFNWRTWFCISFKRNGRGFLWDLHSIVGTWCLACYLLASLTGLYWSYDWYRELLFKAAGVTKTAPMSERKNNKFEQSNQLNQPNKDTTAATISMNTNVIWDSFIAIAPNYQNATFRFPEQQGKEVEVNYLKQNAAHERATDKLTINPESGAISKQDNYLDRSTGQQLLNSIFALHSGSYFGLAGLIAMMLASLCMPLFAITGWMLYLDRRAKKRAMLREKNQLISTPANAIDDGKLLIAYASQTGFAEQLAWRTAQLLQKAGMHISVQPLSAISPQQLANYNQALFVVSTFGDGEAPDSARRFIKKVSQENTLRNMRFGLLALGDRQYQTFCQFGRQLENWLQAQGATTLFSRVEVDQQDSAALELWRTQLNMLAPISIASLVEQEVFINWTLLARSFVNQGSAGMPTYQLELSTEENADWSAGDLLEVMLPDKKTRRTYSIASVPSEKSVQLLIRQVHLKTQQGVELGIGSGWLTHDLRIGDLVSARIKQNNGFHYPVSSSPLIMIGNGTGIAGLRSHLKQRIIQGNHRNWLIFGERNRMYDFYYGDELMAWTKQGWIAQLDAVFSRDQLDSVTTENHYVQHRLQQQSSQLLAWIQDGAAILVCGSLQGMAAEVDAVLRTILGDVEVENLIEQRRYLRDVY